MPSNAVLYNCSLSYPYLNPWAFEGFVNLPLSKFEEWGDKLTGEGAILDAEKDTVVMCHHGMR